MDKVSKCVYIWNIFKARCIQRYLHVYNDIYVYTMISSCIQRSINVYNDLYDDTSISMICPDYLWRRKKRFMTSSSPDHVPMRPWLRPRRRTDGGNLYRRGMESSAAAEVNVPCFLSSCWFKKGRNCKMRPFPEPDRPHFYFFPDAKRRFIQRLVLPG